MNPCAIIGIALAVLAGIGGAWINGNRWEVRYATLERYHAQAIADAATATATKQLELQHQIRSANDVLETALIENERLARSVAAGTGRLYVRATCPSLPAASDAAGGTVAAAPELDPAARPAYFTLRAELAEQFATLTKCRDFANSFTEVTP